MPTTSKKVLHEALRRSFMKKVAKMLADTGEEILVTGSNEIALPCVDSEGNDEFIVITFKVPTGSRDGEAYDGYAMADDFKRKTIEKAEKAEAAAEAKARKIARDEAMREQKRQAKAEHEAEMAKKKGE